MKELTKKKGRPAEERIKEIPLDMIDAPEHKHRIQMSREKLDELKRSILSVGLLNPIEVKEKGDRYEIVHGERRFIAHEELKKVAIPCRIGYRDGVETELAKLHENLMREDISAFEEAMAFEDLVNNHGYSQTKLAHSIGKSEGYISQRLTILNAPAILQEALKDSKLSFSVARELMQITDEAEVQRLTMYAIDNGVSPAVARNWRLSWQANEAQGTNQNESTALSSDTPYSPPKYEFGCAGCGTMTSFSDMHSVNVCGGCKKALIEAQEKD